MSIQTFNPNTNKAVESVEEMTEKMAESAVVGRKNNNGQCCVASRRFIGVEAITDKFIQKIGNNFFKMKKNCPMGPTKEFNPLSSEAAEFQLKNQVKSSVDEGAKVLFRAKPAGREGAFTKPKLTGLKLGIAAYHEELPGPVASFCMVKDEQAPKGLTNDSYFGLGASVFTQDIERGKKIADQIDAGMVFVNHLIWTQASLLFGGAKQFGFGQLVHGSYVEFLKNKQYAKSKCKLNIN